MISKSFWLFVILALSTSAFASLGDDESSVMLDQKKVLAEKRVSKRLQKYTVHELSSEALTIREFADGNGKIFGVAWIGVNKPSFEDILGNHLSEFQDAIRKSRRPIGRRSASRFVSGQLVLEQFGHQGAMRGRAYLPEFLPEGVKANEIQ